MPEFVDLDAPLVESESRTKADVVAAVEAGFEQAPAFTAAWEALGPSLQEFCLVMDEEKGNLTRVALRLKRHRNTMRLWKRRAGEIFKAHGL